MIIDLIEISILILKEQKLIKNIFNRIRHFFIIYILWSKKDRAKAIELREKYQLPKGVWVNDESKILVMPKDSIKQIRRFA
jgi:hypothetical protein